jgi:serine/threonine-protein kinase RsbT
VPPAGEPPSPSASGGADQPVPRSIPITARVDAERARRQARLLATAVGLDDEAAACLAVATMELATNLVRYGRRGVITLSPISEARRTGVRLESQDEGPGIGDIARALTDGYSTGGGLGSGLPAVRRLMDTFELASSPRGTRIVACKWSTGR